MASSGRPWPKNVPCRHLFSPDPPLGKPCVSAPVLRTRPRLPRPAAPLALRALLLPQKNEGPPRSVRSSLRDQRPLLTASAVGVFDASTLAPRAISRPSGPGRWAACGSLRRISSPANISGTMSACLLSNYTATFRTSRTFAPRVRRAPDRLRHP